MNGNKYKILIIEDDEHINNLVATLLEANGYQTLSAYSCEDGMMMYASHRPDLVVLDLGLPDQDGMTFLKRLRKDSLTPVIVLSARSGEKDKGEAWIWEPMIMLQNHLAPMNFLRGYVLRSA